MGRRHGRGIVPLSWLPLSALERGERGGRWKRGGGVRRNVRSNGYETHTPLSPTLPRLPPTNQAEIGDKCLTIYISERGALVGHAVPE
jgi:hypothetical protein